MIRTIALAAAALAAADAGLADGGPIQSGEHEGFSRIVMQVDSTTEWSLEPAPGVVAIFFPRNDIAFGTEDIFRLIPQTRIRAVESRVEPDGTRVVVSLGCDCRASTVFVNGRWLALDIGDRDAPPPPAAAPGVAVEQPAPEPVVESAEAREARESEAVTSAEEILIRQIERAAGQGLIELAGTRTGTPTGTGTSTSTGETGTEEPGAEEMTEPASLEIPPPPPPARPSVAESPVLPLALDLGDGPAARQLTDLLDHDQIRATTVFDRDRTLAIGETEGSPAQSECLDDEAFALGEWADTRPAYVQIVDRASHLLGEFDTPDPSTLIALAQLHIRFGLGLEAEQLLAAYPPASEAGPLLADLARTVDGRSPLPGGPLSAASPCPGAHGLWLALGGAAPAFRDAAHFATVQAAFGELPPDLRALTGPRLIGLLLDAGKPDAARLIHDTTVRPDLHRSAELRAGEARLVAAEGNPAAAVQALGDLVEGNAANAAEALAHLARIAADEDLPLPERLVADLGTAARQFRGTPRGDDFRGLLAETLAVRGEIGPAMREVRAGLVEQPLDPRYPELAVALLAAADPARTGAAAYAETILASQSLLPGSAAADPARLVIAGRLLDLGLAQGARDVIAPASGRGEAPARLIEAEAVLAQGETGAARELLAGLGGPEAASLRARSFARDGDFDSAVATLSDAGLEEEAAVYAWPSGDWSLASAAAGDDGERLALASYMQAREDPAAATPPPPGAAQASGQEAIVEALPDLAVPSLEAARRLLSTGAEVEEFVSGLLGDD